MLKRVTLHIALLGIFYTGVAQQSPNSTAEQSDNGEKNGLSVKKEEATTPWQQDEEEGHYRSYHGVLTHNLSSCMPGKVEDIKPGQTKDVPCECIGIVHAIQQPAEQACDDEFFKTGDREKWIECGEHLPSCKQITDSASYRDLWGKRYRRRCQTYCKDNHCGCCDDGSGGRNNRAGNFVNMQLIMRMVSLQAPPPIMVSKSGIGCSVDQVRTVIYPATLGDAFYQTMRILLK